MPRLRLRYRRPAATQQPGVRRWNAHHSTEGTIVHDPIEPSPVPTPESSVGVLTVYTCASCPDVKWTSHVNAPDPCFVCGFPGTQLWEHTLADVIESLI